MYCTKAVIDKFFEYEFLRFVTVGVFNTCLGFTLIFSFYHFVGLNYILANVLTYMIGLIITFILHKKWVFESSKYYIKEIIPFITIFFTAFLINIILLVVSVKYFAVAKDIGQVIGIVGYSTCNYIGNKYWTFKCKVLG